MKKTSTIKHQPSFVSQSDRNDTAYYLIKLFANEPCGCCFMAHDSLSWLVSASPLQQKQRAKLFSRAFSLVLFLICFASQRRSHWKTEIIFIFCHITMETNTKRHVSHVLLGVLCSASVWPVIFVVYFHIWIIQKKEQHCMVSLPVIMVDSE